MYDLKYIRTKCGMTQKEFAEKTGIPIATLRSWERGVRTPPEYVLKLLVYFLENEN